MNFLCFLLFFLVSICSTQDLVKQNTKAETVSQFYQWIVQNSPDRDAFKKVEFFTNGDDEAAFGYVRIRARQDISEGELIFKFPKSLLMCESNVTWGESVESDISSANSVSLFILSQLPNQTSVWKPYFNVLPRKWKTPSFWKPQELKDLEGTHLWDSLHSSQRALRMEYNTLFPELSEKYPQIFPEETIEFERFGWASLLRQSRRFVIKREVEEDLETCVLPLIELMNFKQPSMGILNFYDDPNWISATAKRQIRAGEQIFLTDKPISNLQLLEFYGTVRRENPADSVGVLIGLSKNDPLIKEKIKAFERAGIQGNEKMFYLFHDIPPSEELLRALRIFSITREEVSFLNKLTDGSITRVSTENELQVWRALGDLCLRILKKYKTTIEDDEKLLSQEKISRNRYNALLLRISDKRILSFHYLLAEKKIMALQVEQETESEKRAILD